MQCLHSPLINSLFNHNIIVAFALLYTNNYIFDARSCYSLVLYVEPALNLFIYFDYTRGEICAWGGEWDVTRQLSLCIHIPKHAFSKPAGIRSMWKLCRMKKKTIRWFWGATNENICAVTRRPFCVLLLFEFGCVCLECGRANHLLLPNGKCVRHGKDKIPSGESAVAQTRYQARIDDVFYSNTHLQRPARKVAERLENCQCVFRWFDCDRTCGMQIRIWGVL